MSDREKEVELKPCPFCGSNKLLSKDTWIECLSCGVWNGKEHWNTRSTPPQSGTFTKEDEGNSVSLPFDCKDPVGEINKLCRYPEPQSGRELPEKKEADRNLAPKEYALDLIHCDGWNACIDAYEKGQPKTELVALDRARQWLLNRKVELSTLNISPTEVVTIGTAIEFMRTFGQVKTLSVEEIEEFIYEHVRQGSHYEDGIEGHKEAAKAIRAALERKI